MPVIFLHTCAMCQEAGARSTPMPVISLHTCAMQPLSHLVPLSCAPEDTAALTWAWTPTLMMI